MRLAVLAVVLSLSTSALAQPGKPLPLKQESKSEMAAILLTLGGIALAGALVVRAADGDPGPGVYLGLAGIVALPSAGHAYAEDWTWTGIGIGSRLAGLVMLAGANNSGHSPGGCHPDFDSPCARSGTARTVEKAGMAVLAASLLVELFHAPYSAHRFNRKHQITVTPTAMSGGGGGLVLGGRF